ncbi:MAG: alpha/beta hydrolase [Syntrophobacterales bacterium]|nr:MAG: alpha/beta hydrolase [Syntrophobacterales bacterium]
MRVERVSFSSHGQAVVGALHLPDMERPPCVIVSHGLFSDKDSEKYITLGDRFPRKGIALLRFDFRGCGESGGKASESTISGRLKDLSMAIGFVRSHPRIGPRIGLMGSSLGGYISLIKAAGEEGIRAVVTWATPFTLGGLEEKRREGEMTSLGEEFFHDITVHNLTSALGKVFNCLVIHGDRDELVPVEHARMIYEGLNCPKKMEVVEGGDHRLTSPDHREKAIEMTLEWFERYLED